MPSTNLPYLIPLKLFLHSNGLMVFEFLDMAINVGKSACMRFGPRFKNACADIVVSGHSTKWEMLARYLGIYLESLTKFKCSFSKNKAGFFEVF